MSIFHPQGPILWHFWSAQGFVNLRFWNCYVMPLSRPIPALGSSCCSNIDEFHMSSFQLSLQTHASVKKKNILYLRLFVEARIYAGLSGISHPIGAAFVTGKSNHHCEFSMPLCLYFEIWAKAKIRKSRWVFWVEYKPLATLCLLS